MVSIKARCSILGCTGKQYAKGYCLKHYKTLLKSNGHHEQSKLNKITQHYTFASIQLYKKGYEISESYIDIEDIDKVKDYRWGLYTDYCYSSNLKLSLHRYVLEFYNMEFDVHHINSNPLDNRKCNLLICTRKDHQRIHAQENEMIQIKEFKEQSLIEDYTI